MPTDEFMKQQFLTLRDEIRESKARIFWLLIIGIVLVMVAGYLAAEHPNAFANAAIPFLLLALMLSFISEQNNIARAGRYLRESVEPQIENMMGWEHWLETKPRLREVDHAFVLGFSVPTKYGATHLHPSAFTNRAVHLLGGRPDVQRTLGNRLHVVSMDCNRFTLDAAFGDYFDGETFRPHPRGGYCRCLRESVRNINALWDDYKLKSGARRKWAELNRLVRPS